MQPRIRILSAEVLADVRAAAWLEQELHPELDRHRRHQMADICEEHGGIDRVRRVMGVAVAEIRECLHGILLPAGRVRPTDVLTNRAEATFRFARHLHPDRLILIREKMHEYMVARVMCDRCADIIPGCAGVWRERATSALAQLREAAASTALRPGTRPLCPL